MSENKDEREHCESVIVELLLHGDEKHRAWLKAELMPLLLCERAAAGKAEYERGRAEEREVRLQCEYKNIKAYADELEQLQSQYESLSATARELVDHIERKYFHLVSPSDKALTLHSELGARARDVHAALAETLSETEEKKT